MSGFRFRLQAVLDWRAAQLEAEETRLREFQQAARQLEDAIADAEAAGAEAEAAVRHPAGVTGADLWALAAYREAARVRAQGLRRRREGQEELIAAQRENVAAARRRCRLLERLKDRRLREWEYEDRRRLEEFAAEAFLARWQTR